MQSNILWVGGCQMGIRWERVTGRPGLVSMCIGSVCVLVVYVRVCGVCVVCIVYVLVVRVCVCVCEGTQCAYILTTKSKDG